jgi:hypothetical protein
MGLRPTQGDGQSGRRLSDRAGTPHDEDGIM